MTQVKGIKNLTDKFGIAIWSDFGVGFSSATQCWTEYLEQSKEVMKNWTGSENIFGPTFGLILTQKRR